jgi:hypothetical protein
MSGRLWRGHFTSNTEFGGGYRIVGTVNDGSSPANYRTRLFDQVTGMLIKEMFSTSGIYTFTWIANRSFYVVCHNHITQKAAIFSDQSPSAM